MNDLNSFIESELTHRVSDYSISPNYILEHYGAERQNIEAYNGRQLLEMLQNADDASSSAEKKKAALFLQDGVLRISNNGEPFDKEGFTSLMYIHRSYKPMKKDMIGQKGLGFRSILSWAKSILIQSGQYHIGFSQQRAESFLKDLIKNYPSIYEFLKLQSEEKYPIAILRIPEIVEKEKTTYDYDTSIIIELKEQETENEVIDQMENMISMETMLFLKNLDELEIKSPKQHILYSRKIKENQILVEKTNLLSGVKTVKTWYLNKVTGTHKKKNYELAIAWNDQLDDQSNLLYSYFETQVKFPFPAILHGTFELTADRNSITNDTAGHNKFLIGVLADLLVDTAIVIANKSELVSYEPLMLLDIDFEAIDPRLQALGFKELLFANIKSKALFPNVNGKYIKHEREPVFYKSQVADIINGPDVSDLLITSVDQGVIDLLNALESFEYSLSKICEIISARVKTLNAEKAAQLLHFLFTEPIYAKDLKSKDFDKGKYSPLLINSKNEHISGDDQIFVQNEQGSTFDLPRSINISFISNTLYAELLKRYGDDNYSLLLSHLRWLGVKVYSFRDIVLTVITHYANADNMDMVLEGHHYLYQLFKLEQEKGIPEQINTQLHVNAISQKNKIISVKSLYFGKYHGNDLAEHLYSYDKNKILASYTDFGLEGEDSHLVTAYFKWLGVAFLPRCYKKEITATNPHYAGYKEHILRGYDYRNPLDPYHERYKDYNHLASELISVDEIQVAEYDEIEIILLRSRPEYIFKWINSSMDLRSTLESNQEIYPSSVTKLTIKSKVYQREFSMAKMRSFTRWVVSTTPWLPVDSVVQKGAPDKCCLSKTITKDYSPYVEKPKIDLEKIAERINVSQDILENYLVLIGVHKDISSFSTNTLYDMLASLEKADTKRTVGSTIYREITSNYNESKIDIQHPAYLKFLEDGKVLCNKGNEMDYFKVNESYYINTKNFGNNILKRFALIAVDKKRGAQKVRKMFGVQPLQNISFNIFGELEYHHLNPKFEEEIVRFKALIYALRMNVDSTGDIKNRIKRTKIHLVERISADFIHAGNKEDFVLEPFEFVNKKGKYYLLIPAGMDDLDELRYSIAMGDAVAEIFTSVINTEEYRSFIRELYSTREINREELLLKEIQLENNDIIIAAKYELNIVDDIRLSFWRAFALASVKHIKSEISNEAKLSQFLSSKLKLEKPLLEVLVNIETYSSLSDLTNQQIFYDLFQQFKLDFTTFSRHFTGLDFILLFKNRYEDLKTTYKPVFMQALYESCLDTGKLEVKKKYFSIVKKYDNGRFITSDRYQIDMMKYFKAQVKKHHQIELNDQGSLFSCNDIIKEHIQLLGTENVRIPELLLESEELLAMVLFYETVEIKRLIEKFNQKEANASVEMKGGKQIKIKGNIFTFSDYQSLAEQLAQTTDFSKFEIQISHILKTELPGKGNKGSGNSRGKRSVRFNTGNEELIGFITEFFAYNQLIQKYTDEKVEWVSENAFRAINAYTSEAGKGYDIELEENGKVRYIEVKGVANIRDGFKMTANEMAKAMEYPDKYDLLIVENPLEEIPVFRYIRSPFRFKKEESLLSNKKMNVLNDNFIIKFKWEA
ncbi:DUF3883 domain-containing protein [Pedobacter gandavensis]|uniref:DUF3883 domain-containing protein n=1 Tax=Pedobacter gandavensis TaxID=2679963 RepID=UPI0029313B59|nr:DUF3883 domain-containing protein [Pedobacter gandavensis]